MRRAFLVFHVFVLAFLSGGSCLAARAQTPSHRPKVDFRKWRPRALEHELGLSYQLLLRPQQAEPALQAKDESQDDEQSQNPQDCNAVAPEDLLFSESSQEEDQSSLRQGLALRYQFTIHPMVAVGSQLQIAFPPVRGGPGDGLFAADGFVLLQWPRFNLVPSLFAGAGVLRRLSRGGPSSLSVVYGARLALAISARARVAFEFRDQLVQTESATGRGLQHLLQFSLGIGLRLGRHAPPRPKPPARPPAVAPRPQNPPVVAQTSPAPQVQDICHGDLHDRPDCDYAGPSDAESLALVDASIRTAPPNEQPLTPAPLPQYASLHFDLNNASLKPTHLQVLDELAKFSKTRPEVLVLITGHTDRLGDTHSNFDLSLARARAVAGYLQAQGIPAARLITHAMSEIEAQDRHVLEEASLRDRRVELRLLRP